MRITKEYLRIIIAEEVEKLSEGGFKSWHPETEKSNLSSSPYPDRDRENRGEYTAAGDCDDDFFGVLLGYLGGDEQSARDFCHLCWGPGRGGSALQRAMEEFNISPDAQFEISQAYDHIFQSDDEEDVENPESGRAAFPHGTK